jgi:hypothetical protein
MDAKRSTRTATQSGVYATRVSASRKLGPVAATHVAQLSCPKTCVFLGAGCYAEDAHLSAYVTKRLNRGVDSEITKATIASIEADAIDALSGDRDLRLHVVGDSTTVNGTRKIAAAAERYMARGGRKAFTYTHAWRSVPRSAWGDVSVLASCETPADVRAASALGYAAVLVVDKHLEERRHHRGGIDLLPCPQETRGVTCAECRLCMDAGRLRDEGLTIAFAVHGSPASKSKAVRSLRRRHEMTGGTGSVAMAQSRKMRIAPQRQATGSPVLNARSFISGNR